ncbi:crotonase/enoyl-CoA hydratase family protein [Gymnodinialimonas ceratoperidinii]|uniref:Crotonase/enoyl-CoA hydratase family protein n=1 Tax=Gymnodinialimonas ceratoperidinii TaxID=2856823 RepID=A0A8F6TVQ8_9RHOB|nr:crotonase/enoyl-CoA hydratase family protein [Gymnodinialimonas ceratoperidinii]QXT39585.1 crotonase/enoyl-CoA hydratase family protein [Gymnodinialimonas ceratoperidinii]
MSLDIAIEGRVATLTLKRPDKRNAMNDALLAELSGFCDSPPEGVRVAILTGAGDHFCAGLDLAEQHDRDAAEGLAHSRGWHRALERVQFGGLPIVTAMRGAVIGGGMEVATACHVRVAGPDVRFQLPEGKRGFFVGGGATVRVGRIIGPDRLTEMMLTGRTYGAEEGLALGLCHYVTDDPLAKARELAEQIASNARMSNYFAIHGVSKINSMAPEEGFFTEALCTAMAQTSPDAKEGFRAFLDKRAPEFK